MWSVWSWRTREEMSLDSWPEPRRALPWPLRDDAVPACLALTGLWDVLGDSLTEGGDKAGRRSGWPVAPGAGRSRGCETPRGLVQVFWAKNSRSGFSSAWLLTRAASQVDSLCIRLNEHHMALAVDFFFFFF